MTRGIYSDPVREAERRAEIAATLRGRKHSPKARAKMVVAQQNRSPEHRARLSAALLASDHRGERSPNWKGGREAYDSWHKTLRRTLGSATDQVCIDCGGPARHWSLSWRRVPEDRLEFAGPGRRLPFTRDPADYDPRCRSCAGQYDADWRAA